MPPNIVSKLCNGPFFDLRENVGIWDDDLQCYNFMELRDAFLRLQFTSQNWQWCVFFFGNSDNHLRQSNFMGLRDAFFCLQILSQNWAMVCFSTFEESARNLDND